MPTDEAMAMAETAKLKIQVLAVIRPSSLDDQLKKKIMTSCTKNKEKALEVLKGLCGDPECTDAH